jgi:DNA-binding response OmpR family regulator
MKQHATVLIVDDEPQILLVMEVILSNEGYRVIKATNGKECLEITKRELPDLILMDVFMPTMDGFKALKRLRAQKRTKHIPVVFLTAIATKPMQIEKGLSLGAEAYITKPIKVDELMSRVRAILHKAQDRKQIHKPPESRKSSK